jgi:creatinine amidohydrolase
VRSNNRRHLPIAVDAAISLGVLGKAFEKLDTNIAAFALPCLYYGKSNEHWSFPAQLPSRQQPY